MILINSALKQNLFWKNLQIQSVRNMIIYSADGFEPTGGCWESIEAKPVEKSWRRKWRSGCLIQLQRAGAHLSISCSTPNQGKRVPGENPHGYKENIYIPHGKTDLEANPEPFCSDAALTRFLWRKQKKSLCSYDSQLKLIQFTGVHQDCRQVL